MFLVKTQVTIQKSVLNFQPGAVQQTHPHYFLLLLLIQAGNAEILDLQSSVKGPLMARYSTGMPNLDWGALHNESFLVPSPQKLKQKREIRTEMQMDKHVTPLTDKI